MSLPLKSKRSMTPAPVPAAAARSVVSICFITPPMRLSAGSSVAFQSVHLHANGTDSKSHLEVGFKFHPRGYKPTLNFRQLFVGNGPDLDIKGNEANQRVDAYFTLPQPVKISTYEPHMHAPGVRMCLEAIWGVSVQTLNCSKYDHNWVRAYWYLSLIHI